MPLTPFQVFRICVSPSYDRRPRGLSIIGQGRLSVIITFRNVLFLDFSIDLHLYTGGAMSDKKISIVYKRVSELIPYAKNPRKNDAAVKFVAESIKNFGFKNPVILDKNDIIVAGHTRLKAAQSLGITEVPCVYADDLTDEQIKAFRLADNKTSEFAEWDSALLADELDGILDIDMDIFGFDTDAALDGFKAPIEVEEDKAPDADTSKTPNARLGDIYQLGSHRLMCGSSTDAADVKALMDGATARMLFTSPPYADMRTYGGDKNLNVDFLAQFIPTYRPYTDYQVVNLGIKRKDNEIVPYWDKYIAAAHEAGYKLMAWNVWDKGSAGSILAEKAFVPLYHEWLFLFGTGAGEITAEFMMVFGTEFFDIHRTVKKKAGSIGLKGRTSKRNADGSMGMHTQGDTSRPYKQMGSILTVPPENTVRDHPAAFPLGLPSAYIQAFTKQGDIVIESFCGSGTTIIACEQTGRTCYAMELDPGYVDLAIARWEKFTGKKAVLLSRRGDEHGEGRTTEEGHRPNTV